MSTLSFHGTNTINYLGSTLDVNRPQKEGPRGSKLREEEEKAKEVISNLRRKRETVIRAPAAPSYAVRAKREAERFTESKRGQ
jgi:hypothetical protein